MTVIDDHRLGAVAGIVVSEDLRMFLGAIDDVGRLGGEIEREEET